MTRSPPGRTLSNTARVFTPEDKAIQTPNSDTTYSFLGADLRAEPLVISVPEVEANRYYSLQFIDMYTFNFAYVGSRATGNHEGNFLLAGPGLQGHHTTRHQGGDTIAKLSSASCCFRTQLFNPADIGNVKKIQASYKARATIPIPQSAHPTGCPR